ncbi:MAG: oxygen-dependent coproporphyrinogen oxidase [Saprospiraceae bacterium]
MVTKEQIAERFQGIQDQICAQLSEADGTEFREDLWTRAEGGGGRTRTIQGKVIEKGGVAFSAVHGPLPDAVAKGMKMEPCNFFATGVSIVLHPHSPMAPIIHMNIRYFETDSGKWWFGGGIDLTPHYINEEDARYFHRQLKEICDQSHPDFYPKFKEQADTYFYLPHRNETRGIGGVFYDYQDEASGLTREALFEFAIRLGENFAPIYTSLLERAADRPWGEREKTWQLIRRGRYVEFNLVWDRGTKFGLQTNGRIESILMSMPPFASWEYMHKIEENSPEAHTLQLLKKGIDWIQ